MGSLRVLNYLFGSEEIVEVRRELVLLREKLLNHNNSPYRHLCTGSLGEGVAFPPSDDDIMISKINYRAIDNPMDNKSGGVFFLAKSLNIGSFRRCKDNCCFISDGETYRSSDGYCLLLDLAELLPKEYTYNVNGIRLFSSELFKKELKKPRQYIHGPCLSSTYGVVDKDETTCVVCPFWPKNITEWKTRKRSYGWPSTEIIQSIIESGHHLVPIGQPDSIYRNHEWRLSFSLAERTLMHSFNHAQFLIYNILRYALKMVIDKQFPDVLCSYFMKTTLFHTIERTSRYMWRVDNLDICYRVCLAVLYIFIDYKNFPNYFIPKYNMIKKKVNDTNRQQLLDLVRDLISNGIIDLIDPYMSLIDNDERTYSKKLEGRYDFEIFTGYHFSETCAAVREFFIFEKDGKESSASLIRKVLHRLYELANITDTQHEYRKIVILEGIASCCKILMNRYCSSTEQNKQKYHLHKATLALLRLGQMKGSEEGKLTISNYMYLIGKTETALSVIERLLSEYPPHKYVNIRNCVTKNGRLEFYCEYLCGRGYTLYFKERRLWTKNFKLSSYHLNAYPSPMKMWISIAGIVTVHPVVYALFLESLSHIQRQNSRLLLKSISRLFNITDQLGPAYYIASARMCIGIVLYVAGDNQSAYTCFKSTYEMKGNLSSPHKETFTRAALTYFACVKFKELIKPGGNRKPQFQFKLENYNIFVLYI